MKPLIILIFLVFQSPAQAADTFCEAWYQASGGPLEKIKMEIQSTTTQNTIFSASQHSYDYKVDWNFELTTFYVSISSNGNSILGTTARVPTLNHPENFTDLNIPNGPRLSVNCEIVAKTSYR